MSDEPIDLSPLDPDLDADAEGVFVARVMERVGTRPLRIDPLYGVWLIARPVMVAASIALAAAIVVLVRSRSSDGQGTVAEAIGIPRDLLAIGRAPERAP